MRLLLDTHAFMWLINEPEKLSEAARSAYNDRGNEVLLSAVSAWELQIKIQIGKLRALGTPLRDAIATERERRNITILGLELDHVFGLGDLEHHHRDPFDRLLIAQARVERAKLVTNDPEIAKYEVETLW